MTVQKLKPGKRNLGIKDLLPGIDVKKAYSLEQISEMMNKNASSGKRKRKKQ